MNDQLKIIVLDDDPTGSQTVHSCLLLMKWDVETLRIGLRDELPIFFILTNTRAISPKQAAIVTQEVCRNLKIALAAEKINNFLVVSRSDSTLRGHYPLETDVIAQELGDFDAHFLTPAFFEGGRVTINSNHYLLIDGKKVPVSETEFAGDSVFGFNHSYLPDYVAEKTQGKIASEEVIKIQLEDLYSEDLINQLLSLNNNSCVVVDGKIQEDFDRFATALFTATKQGKRFLLRSAASLITSLAQLGQQATPPEAMASYKTNHKPGVIVIGSHVKKTTRQLEQLLQQPSTVGIEVEVIHLRDHPETRETILQSILHQVLTVWRQGKTPVIFTSREEVTFVDLQERIDFGRAISDLLMDIIGGLPSDIGFLISKGGITSNNLLSKGLNLTTVRLLGQILPGCCVVRTAKDHPQFPCLPVVLFPGNVGNDRGLVTAWEIIDHQAKI
ncbi:MAG: four-carbon acid sugar kinase family protein [Xenococcus sp. MO_188.B8]|nr:four-carbon acid sugar kinase family protein [Xenococcus sp. MO_188.B8]